MITYKRLDHVYLSVPPGKEHDAHLFYTEVLGFVPMERPSVFDSTGYWYRLPGMEIHTGVENGKPLAKPHFAMEVADLEAARQHLESKGITIVKEVPIPGRNRFAFYDPFGNRIELLEYV
jgi:catechol 2,3-dioxygenase-like lactoylglutathione lyase family enzyme